MRIDVLTDYCISTHTPLAGRDLWAERSALFIWNFYSHAPCGARRPGTSYKSKGYIISTHTPLAGRDDGEYIHDPLPKPISTHTPLAGRDDKSCGLQAHVYDFYSHAPRGARLCPSSRSHLRDDFYSHAPRGARPFCADDLFSTPSFLLTRPSRGATGQS